MYLTFHSFGQYVLYGWGYDKIDAPNADQLRTMGNVAAEAMRIENGGSPYSVGVASKLMYSASGRYHYYTSGRYHYYTLCIKIKYVQ